MAKYGRGLRVALVVWCVVVWCWSVWMVACLVTGCTSKVTIKGPGDVVLFGWEGKATVDAENAAAMLIVKRLLPGEVHIVGPVCEVDSGEAEAGEAVAGGSGAVLAVPGGATGGGSASGGSVD